MFNFFKSFFKKIEKLPEGFTGALLNPTPPEEEITLGEIVGKVSPVKWEERAPRMFPKYDQLYSYTCGAFAGKKLAGVFYWASKGVWLEFSEEDIYQRRANKPGAGMFEHDIYAILGQGVTLKALTNASIVTDADADNHKIEPYAREVGKVFAMGRKIVVPIDIEAIASVIQVTGKAVLILLGFTSSEWSRETPVIEDLSLNLYAQNTLRHYVVITDFVLVNGQKRLVIDDSAAFGGLYKRNISAEWLAKRTIAVSYPMNFKFQAGVSLNDWPRYTGTIVSAQKCLRFEGFFPLNVDFAENLGPVTRDAVRKFQTKHGLAVVGLLDVQTRATLASMYP